MGIRPSGDGWSMAYDDAGIRDLASRLQSLGPAARRLEATGGLELPLVASLAATALLVVVVNPRQVRDFAKATGPLAKTDSLDAAVLAHFAEAVRPPLRPLRDAETQALKSLVARRQQVMTMLVAERNRLLPFDQWTGVFGSERLTGALLDRLTHHVHILEMNGESYRLKRSRENAAPQASDEPCEA